MVTLICTSQAESAVTTLLVQKENNIVGQGLVSGIVELVDCGREKVNDLGHRLQIVGMLLVLHQLLTTTTTTHT